MANQENRPVVSVIMPVYNGRSMVDRAVSSVAAQSMADWELLAIDEGSSDGSFDALQAWAGRDPRIRALHTDGEAGLSAARNVALRCAQGEFVAYLDQDDQYAPDYLSHVARLRDTADVLVFAYDLVYQDAQPAGQAWRKVRAHLDDRRKGTR